MGQIGVLVRQEPDLQVRRTRFVAQEGWKKFVRQRFASKAKPKQIRARPCKKFHGGRRQHLFEDPVD
jgi:hypothetical protein